MRSLSLQLSHSWFWKARGLMKMWITLHRSNCACSIQDLPMEGLRSFGEMLVVLHRKTCVMGLLGLQEMRNVEALSSAQGAEPSPIKGFSSWEITSDVPWLLPHLFYYDPHLLRHACKTGGIILLANDVVLWSKSLLNLQVHLLVWYPCAYPCGPLC